MRSQLSRVHALAGALLFALATGSAQAAVSAEEAAKLGLPEADFDMADTRGGKIVASLYNDFIPQAV